jgi:hypothetical protein
VCEYTNIEAPHKCQLHKVTHLKNINAHIHVELKVDGANLILI